MHESFTQCRHRIYASPGHGTCVDLYACNACHMWGRDSLMHAKHKRLPQREFTRAQSQTRSMPQYRLHNCPCGDDEKNFTTNQGLANCCMRNTGYVQFHKCLPRIDTSNLDTVLSNYPSNGQSANLFRRPAGQSRYIVFYAPSGKPHNRCSRQLRGLK